MAYSNVIYTGTGTQTNFAVPFPYLSQSHVSAYVNGVITSFSWLSAAVVSISPAPALNSNVVLQRSTPAAQMVSYTDGSTISASDMNTANLQTIYISQEVVDAVSTKVGLSVALGSYDFGNLRLSSVATPANASDATNKAYVDGAAGAVSSTLTSHIGAGGAAHAVATSATNGFLSAADKAKLDGLATVASSGRYSDLTGAPSLSTVATSGSYNDLSSKPVLGAAAALNVGTAAGTVAAGNDSRITGALAASTAASTYAPLTGSGTSGTWPISIGGNAASASAVAWSNVTGRPTAVSTFANDSGYLTASGTIANANAVPWTGVTGRPTAVSAFSNDAGYLTAGGTIANANAAPWSGVTGKPTTLAGYGITDGLTAATAASTYAALNSSPSFTGNLGTQGVLLAFSPTSTNGQFVAYSDGTEASIEATRINDGSKRSLRLQPYGGSISLAAGNGNVALGSGGLTISSGVPGTTTNTLYNNGGNLYWGTAALATGSAVSGTTGYVPVFTGAASLGNSGITYSSSTGVTGFSKPVIISDTTTAGWTDQGALRVAGDFGLAGQMMIGKGIRLPYVAQYGGITANNNSVEVWGLHSFSSTGDNGRLYLSNGGTVAVDLRGSGTSFINGGSLGIGTTSPAATLDVNGTLALKGVTAASQWLLNVTTPEAYGAAGDGTTDDTTALSNALNSGKSVYLPGKYKITSAISATIAATSGFRMFGDGQRSQILLSGASTGITLNVTYTGALAGQNGQTILRDFAVVAKTAASGTAATSSAGFGMLNIKGTGASSDIGIEANNLEINNLTFQGDGTGWHYHGLLLQDVRCSNISFNAAACIGGTTGSGGAAGSAAAVFKTTNQSGGNVPTALVFEKCKINGGDRGIYFIASGATSGSVDPQGVWIVNSTIIGQSTASIDLNATDANNVEWRVHGCSLNATTKCINASGTGMVRFTDNTFVVGTNSGGYGVYITLGNGNWPAGQISNNVTFGQGSSTVCIGGTYNFPSGVSNGYLRIDGNTSMNTGGSSTGYPISGTAVSKGTNT